MAHLSLSLLGPFQATLDGRPITDFKSIKVRALLAYLAVEAHRPHPRETLAGLLWPEYPDRAALDNLRYTLSDLRGAIGDRHAAPPFLCITRDTLQFNPDSDYDLDVRSFQGHFAERPDPIDQLHAAIELYRGSFLEGFSIGDSAPFEEWALLKKEQFERQMLAALRALAADYERRGEFQQAEPHARRQLDLAPWDEETHQQLMRILALSRQRSAALAQYDVCRRALKQELGIEPSRATAQLYADIRDGRFETGANRWASAASIETPQLSNVPIPLTSFVGRQREVARIAQLLAPPAGDTEGRVRLLTLIGTGGCGKTRLAVQVAHDLAAAQRFKHGVGWVDLSRLGDPALVPQAVAAVLGLRESSTTSLTGLITNYLRSKHMLLIFDNCEHLIEASAQLIDAVLSACPQVQVMATSREAVGLTGENAYRVPSLDLPATGFETSPKQLLQSDAIQLFVERAVTVAANWRFDSCASTVARICARLDGIPLAIELAAARLKLLSIDQIATRLADRFQLLTGGSRTALPRHQTLRATMDWSYGLLTDDERVLFRRLAVFAGSWTFEAAEAIAGQGDLLPDKVLDGLTHLVDKSLVAVTPQTNEVRYRMLETIHEYAREKLIDAGEIEMMRAYHLKFYVQFAEQAEPLLQGTEQKQWLDRLEAEDDDLRAALAWSLGGGAVTQGLTLAVALAEFWHLRGYLSEGRQWLKRMLANGSDAPPALRAKAIRQSGWLALQQGAISQAKAMGEECLTLYRDLGDQPGIAYALVLAGTAAHFLGEDEQAASLLQESLSLFQQVDDRSGYTYALLWVARGQMRRGETTQAAALLESSLDAFRELGNKDNLSFALGSLGDLARRQGDYARAADLRKDSLRLAWEIGSKVETCYALEHLALIASANGAPERAATLWGTTEVLRESLNRSLAPSYAAEYGPAVAGARAQLGEERFAAAWAAGRALPIEEAIELALT
jgi:predicted ATPase/DNA-binding SARP family transcriptional activator